MRDGARGDVDDPLAVPVDGEPVAVGDLPDDGGEHVPLAADGEEVGDLGRLDDRAHALLRLAHQDLGRGERAVAQRNGVEVDVHAAGAGAGQLGRRAGEAGAAEVLDAGDEVGGEDLQAGLDQQLLGERVADLHARALGRAVLVERLAGQHADPADAVAAGAGAEQDHLVADALGLGQADVRVPHDADAQGVDQRVAGVAVVEEQLAADVGQAEAVAIAADPGDDARQHAGGVGSVCAAEAQRVHDGDRAGAHGEDVADDAADPGGRALVRLDVARVVVRLDLEGHRVAVADIDDAGVLADADQQGLAVREVAELLEVDLGALVGAVLAPHHGVHGQLGGGGPAAEDVADPQVLVGLQAQFGEGLLVVRCLLGPLDGVDNHGSTPTSFRSSLAGARCDARSGVVFGDVHAFTTAVSTLVKKPRPSMLGPVRSSTACSGCGMRPTTRPFSLVTPAMSRELPFGLPST